MLFAANLLDLTISYALKFQSAESLRHRLPTQIIGNIKTGAIDRGEVASGVPGGYSFPLTISGWHRPTEQTGNTVGQSAG